MASSSRNIRKILKSKKVASPSPSMVTCFILCKTGFGSLFVWEHLTLCQSQRYLLPYLCTRAKCLSHGLQPGSTRKREDPGNEREVQSFRVASYRLFCFFFLANFDLFLRLRDNLILGLSVWHAFALCLYMHEILGWIRNNHRKAQFPNCLQLHIKIMSQFASISWKSRQF